MPNIFHKKLLILLTVGGLLCGTVQACDVCGCGAGGVFLGMMPQYKKYFGGLRYQHRSYQSHLGSATGLLRTSETFSTAEWYAGAKIGNKSQAMVFVPYQWHRQQGLNQSVQIQGMGDVTLMGTTQLWEHVYATEANKIRMHTLHAGAGIKLPTGKWQFANEGQLGQHANFMPGSGTIDALALLMYQYSAGNTGIAASAMYRHNTTNSHAHRFGNRAQLAAQGFYKIKINDKQKLTPNAGLMAEAFGKDEMHNEKVEQSGGWAGHAMLGCEYSVAAVAAGLVWQPPLAQQMSGGEVKLTGRGMLYLTLVF